MEQSKPFKKDDGIRIIAWISSLIASLAKDKTYIVELKEYRKKRSLDANAYCWVLIDKLAEKTGLKKEEIYREAICQIGGVSDIICAPLKAAEKIRRAWERNGLGWQAVPFKSKIEDCINMELFYGSSTYNTVQMSRLIDCIVQDCKAVGIETMPPDELESLLKAWDA